ncbi:neuromedin U [Gemmatimonadota bacterium]
MLTILAVALIGANPALAQDQEQDAKALAKQSQNPIANIYSLPLQNNTSFGVGPNEATNNTLNIQPVLPVTIGKVNLINRFILPVQWQGEVVDGIGSKSGLGDLTYEGFFSPAKASKVTWGLGPALIIPTATDDRLGSGKWSAGPALVVLTQPGNWVVGGIVQNTWSFAGDEDRSDVNLLFSQIFVNYNLKKGWYLSSAPIITANWEADSGDQWTVPLGGGAGKLQHVGKLPMDFQVQVFYNVVKPEYGADWTLRVQAKALFIK